MKVYFVFLTLICELYLIFIENLKWRIVLLDLLSWCLTEAYYYNVLGKAERHKRRSWKTSRSVVIYSWHKQTGPVKSRCFVARGMACVSLTTLLCNWFEQHLCLFNHFVLSCVPIFVLYYRCQHFPAWLNAGYTESFIFVQFVTWICLWWNVFRAFCVMQYVDNFRDCFASSTGLVMQTMEDQIFSIALATTCPPDLPPTKVSSHYTTIHA
jgi:hypothetical protein